MELSSKLLKNAVEHISSLPGIGRRTAFRLALFMLNRDKSKTILLADSLKNLVENIQYCLECYNISDTQTCEICSNLQRERQILCVVEDIRDIVAIESTGQYNGVYHVLGGIISPMDGVGPFDINSKSLIERSKQKIIQEIIFALSSTIEGDTTVYYLFKKIYRKNLKFSTIARGISVGNQLEYTDEITLGRSIKNRIPYEKSLKY